MWNLCKALTYSPVPESHSPVYWWLWECKNGITGFNENCDLYVCLIHTPTSIDLLWIIFFAFQFCQEYNEWNFSTFIWESA